MNTEIYALKKNKTWTLVPPSSEMTIVHNKWVYRIKLNADGSIERFKARLVAKGFQQVPGVDFFETYSPVVKPCTIRLMFTMAVTYGWEIQQLDINNAFLNGELKEAVYMYQPQGFVDPQFPNHVCKLNKAIYGLKQAPRAWFDKLKQSLQQWGFSNSKADSSLFFSNTNGKLLLILVYVDDILITGHDQHQVQHVISTLQSKFALKILGPVSYFLGFEVIRDGSHLYLTQHKYTKDLLNSTQMNDSKSQPTPMCSTTKLSQHTGTPMKNPTMYRSVLGALQYLTMTRPDIAFAVNRLSQFQQAPTSDHWSACKRILRYLSGTLHEGLHFAPAKTLDLQGFTDADWAGCYDDRKSTSGYCIYFGGNLVSWCSKKQTVVARSSTESEYRALALATTELVWIQSVLKEVGIPFQHCPILWCDNLGAGSLASNPVFHARTKHIEVDLHFVRDKVIAQELDVRYVDTSHQIADIFTKPLAATPFLHFRNKLTHVSDMYNLRGDVEIQEEDHR
uniref:Reverse transcriptase Ty1/copia-type domain-containing protein n=1 Tax=Cannabis sativa TaxID=3483 RepID=A0A803R1P3_CANSA